MPDEPGSQSTAGERPQFATAEDAEIASVDWLVEPCWTGTRLLARLRDGTVTFSDSDGNPPGPELDQAGELLARAIDADSALIDGSWTPRPWVGDGEMRRARGEGRSVTMPETLPERRTFVAWDLLELEGTSLRDVPFVERRRLLQSVVTETTRVRVSPAVHLPLNRWLTAWAADGFTHVVAKHVNSRYRNGAIADDWLKIRIGPDRPRGVLERFFGRSFPARRIED